MALCFVFVFFGIGFSGRLFNNRKIVSKSMLLRNMYRGIGFQMHLRVVKDLFICVGWILLVFIAVIVRKSFCLCCLS